MKWHHAGSVYQWLALRTKKYICIMLIAYWSSDRSRNDPLLLKPSIVEDNKPVNMDFSLSKRSFLEHLKSFQFSKNTFPFDLLNHFFSSKQLILFLLIKKILGSVISKIFTCFMRNLTNLNWHESKWHHFSLIWNSVGTWPMTKDRI